MRAKQTKQKSVETAESMAQKQREISVSEFFLKNRHLLGFDNPRKALLTTVKEAVDNALDACEEAGILPEIGVDIQQTGENRFSVAVTDNGPGILRAQIPKIFAKLLYGSKFHRLRMSRGQQGIGISAAGMYGQLTTGSATKIYSKTKKRGKANYIEVQIDARQNKPTILKDEEIDWQPEFYPAAQNGKPGKVVAANHGTCVAIEMEASYVRGKLSVDEYLKQCAVVNPHLQLHYRVVLQKKGVDQEEDKKGSEKKDANEANGASWVTFERIVKRLPPPPCEIKPHPHGVELGMLLQMLKDSTGRTVRAMLQHDFSRVSSNCAAQMCKQAGISLQSRPAKVTQQEVEALFAAIQSTKLMRPPTDCLSPIEEEHIIAGLKKEIEADFYTAVTRFPAVYRGNPFQIEVGIAYAKPGQNEDLTVEEPVRVMRFANRVPLLHMAGACAISKSVMGVNWKSYGLSQPRGGLPCGPMVVMVHMASVWVPFTSESKEAIAHYPEIIKEVIFGLQECGRRLSVYLSKRRRLAEIERKKNYMTLYIPHLALGLKQVLDLNDRQENKIISTLNKMLERTHVEQ